MVMYELDSIALSVSLASSYDQTAEGNIWRCHLKIKTCGVCWHSVTLYDLD